MPDSTAVLHQTRAHPRRRPSLDFSYVGFMYCGIMMFMGLAAVNSQANLLFGVFGLMIGVLLVSVSMSRMVLRRLRIKRLLPDHAVVGQSMLMSYECSNQKRFWPSLSVTVAELDGNEAFTRQPLAYMLHAAPGTTAVIGTELIPKRRGLHVLNRYQITTSFPFGFLRRSQEGTATETLLVYPPIGKVDRQLLLRCRAADSGGATLRPRRGGNDEFYGLKEYRTGENPRLIYWRRTAHTGVLVSKEMTIVAPPRLLILVDTFRVGDTAEESAVIERGIAMAASLISHALQDGLMVGLIAWSGHWNAAAPNRGKRHNRDLLTTLARLPINRRGTPAELLEQARQLTRTGITRVMFTPRTEGFSQSEATRSALLMLNPSEAQTRLWISFDSAIDFSEVVTTDQRLPSEHLRRTRWFFGRHAADPRAVGD